MGIIEDLRSIVGEDQIRTDTEAIEIYSKDWTPFYKPAALGVVFPRSANEVQEIVRLCLKYKQAIVPSGGRTGLSGAAAASNAELVISFEQMNQILEFNEVDCLVRVQPGLVTKELQNFAEEKGYYFPVDFASAGSSQIGGNIATNAGGLHVLRYGNIRNWIAGLEIVTGTGEKLSLNDGLVKNATGLDLRHLLIGSEGCLGLITEAQIRLTRLPKEKTLFLFGLNSWKDSLQLFKYFQKTAELSAFEVFTQACIEKVMDASDLPPPLAASHEIYVVCELEGGITDEELDYVFDQSWINDGVQAQSRAQFEQIWSYRENISESIARFRPYKNDISVLASKIPEFIAKLEKLIKEQYPDYEVLWFGHMGDGNLHINILKPEKLELESFKKSCERVSEILFACVRDFRGSVSAEHGVGLLKKPHLHYSRSEYEINLMREIKKVFDPAGILNPGKIFD